jgi:site-specific DNA-methyltransferase (cytosine-N4-specific)
LSPSAVAATQSPEDELAAFFARIAECSDTTYATHGLHPYPAKFIPHIPRAVIRAYSEPGDTVWDPMCGSGTSLVEAVLADRHGIGGDLNPVAVLVSRAKTTLLAERASGELRSLAASLDAKAAHADAISVAVPDFPNRDHWFDPLVSRELAYALQRIETLRSASARALAKCAFSAIVVAVSNQESETRWSAKPQRVIPGRSLTKLARRLLDSLKRLDALAAEYAGTADVRLEDARASSVPDRSVQLVVTSPPYANSHDYYLYNKLRMFWLGYEVSPVQEAEIGSRNRHSDKGEEVDGYLDAMTAVLTEIRRGLVDGGHAVIVVGDSVIRKQLFDMGELLSERAASVGLIRKRGFRFDHRRFNSTFQRGFGTAHSKKTHVLILRRD